MPSQYSKKSQASASQRSAGPTGSPMQTQLLPEAWYMMNAVRSALNSNCLSPSSAKFALVSWPFAIRISACCSSSWPGGARGGLEGRSNRHNAYAAVIMAASNRARKLRGADASNSNCHHRSLP